MSNSAHQRGGGPSSAGPVPLATLRTVRDVVSTDAAEDTLDRSSSAADEASHLAFTEQTSLLTLMEAILGAPAGRIRDHSAQVREVDNQIRALRDELGLSEPPPPAPPAPTRTSAPTFEPALDHTDDSVPPPHGVRRSTWRTLVAGLATRRRQHVGVLAVVSLTSVLW